MNIKLTQTYRLCMKAVCLASLPSLLSLLGCSDEFMAEQDFYVQEEIVLSGDISQTYVTRANDSGFAAGDCIGVYIVDYENGQPGTLALNGNRANNYMLTLDSSSDRWQGNGGLYWKDEQTAVDIYGYYPYDNAMESMTEHIFSVQSDQSREGGAGEMSGYEKSDFLWAKKAKVSPTKETIFLNFEHRLAGIKVVLQQGEGFVGDEWSKVKRVVTIENTALSAHIDMNTGIATASEKEGKSIIAAPQDNDTYRAVVIPQTVNAGKSLVGVTIDGTLYKYVREETTKLQQGKMHTFTLKIDKREGGDYTLSLVSESINPWENDKSSHNFEAAAYTIINCPKEGTFEECVAKTGKNPGEILNLKVVGRMDGTDFEFLRNNMPQLQGLNLYDVIPIGQPNLGYAWNWEIREVWKNYFEKYIKIEEPNEYYLPPNALRDMSSLRHIILPNNLIVLGDNCLYRVGLAFNSTLVIPNTVKIIDTFALSGMNQGRLQLSDSIEFIGGHALYENQCYFEWNLGNSLRYIGDNAMDNVTHCSGYFKLSENLEYIGERAFCNFGENLLGEITIPSAITTVPAIAFFGMKFTNGVTLTLHEGITRIGSEAFQGLTFNNRIIWPERLLAIGNSAFQECRFRGGLNDLPKSLEILGSAAFYYCQYLPDNISLPTNLSRVSDNTFRGTSLTSISIPQSVESIEESAFTSCPSLQSVSIGQFVEEIGDGAFAACPALKDVRCLATTPPTLGEKVFLSCDFDHLILEVPEKSVNAYRNAEGWKQIKYITAYHELAVSLSNITCLDKGIAREMMVRSEDAWEVQNCPSWVHLSQTSSNINTTELTVKVDASLSAREGEIVFKLKNNDYTTTCNIKQYVAAMAEDKEIVLQTASAGATPIPIFIIGDGFTAEQIADGTYLSRVKEQMEHFFAIEPFKTYRNYFTVSTALAASPEKGISSAKTVVKNRFNTTYDPMGAQCGDVGYRCNYDELKDYAANVSQGINHGNINNVLFMIVMNEDNCVGDAWIDDSGATFAFAANSPDPYPYDTRGLVQHYAGGKGFGRLAPEYVAHFDFLKACTCPCCNGITRYYEGRAKGWYGNVSLNGSMNTVPWSHLIFDSRYSDLVDVFEGGYRHARGTFRSENMSVMSNYIQYFNTYSRELIVRRIMQLAGLNFDFEEFVRKDSREGLPE